MLKKGLLHVFFSNKCSLLCLCLTFGNLFYLPVKHCVAPQFAAHDVQKAFGRFFRLFSENPVPRSFNPPEMGAAVLRIGLECLRAVCKAAG